MRVSVRVRSCVLGIKNQKESLDSSISSNLTEREGKKERKRKIKKERENGRSLGFWGFQFSCGNASYSKIGEIIIIIIIIIIIRKRNKRRRQYTVK